jgi:PAS domain S-box-containing protein
MAVELHEGSAAMQAILDCINQPVWVVDAAGAIAFVNPAGVAALGYDSLDELVGKPGHDTIHYKHADGTPFPASECPMSRSRDTGVAFTMEEDWFVRRDGSMFPVSYTSTPIETPGGLGLVVSFTDITEHRRAERAARERDVARARADELRAARKRIIEAADVARAQLERDLHDGAQQQFVSAVIHLQMAERRAETDPDGAHELRERAIEMAGAGITELRRLAAGIHPAVLTERGLGPAVQSLADRLPLPVCVLARPDERFAPAVEASVYFFVSEALTNVVKHAEAGSATVSLAAANGDLEVEVGDDGMGGARTAGGSGLRGLGDRVAALDGTLDVESPPGAGTRLRATIPLRT